MKSNLFFLNILHVFNDGYFSSSILILPFITKDLSLNLFQAGILGSLTGFMGILLALPAGSAAVKWGGMKVLLAALGIYATSFILLGATINFATVFLCFVIAALGFSVFHPIGFALVSKLSTKSTRGTQIGTFTAIGDIGKIGITTLLTIVIAFIGWRYTSLAYGLLAVVALIIFTFIHHKNPHIHVTEKSKDLAFKTLLKNKRFVLASLAGTLDVFASFPLFIFLPFLLLEKGFGTAILGGLVGAYLVGNLLGKTILGRAIDKYGHIKVFVLAELLMALFILLLATSNNIILIVTYSIILGLLTKGTVPVTQTMVSDSVEHHGNFEKSISTYSVIANVSVAGAPVLLGAISNTFGVTYAFITLSIFALSAIIPALFIPFVKHHD
ncbi:MAG: MFS transporter [Candidatus Levybacteria bacterium]|nr:MFS transporter [Candidatus Levybacteria bacterium]